MDTGGHSGRRLKLDVDLFCGGFFRFESDAANYVGPVDRDLVDAEKEFDGVVKVVGVHAWFLVAIGPSVEVETHRPWFFRCVADIVAAFRDPAPNTS